MKIAITSLGDSPDAPVDPRFGRAAKFIVIDTETGAFEAVDNSSGLGATHGAGVQAADKVARLGVQCLVSGHCGPKAFRTLQAAGVSVYSGAEGTVGQALQAFREGRLTLAGSADVDGVDGGDGGDGGGP